MAVRRADGEHDVLPETLVVDAERDRVTDEPGAVDDLLDLGRAHAVARGLDHLVLAADEVQEPFLVAADEVAREDRRLGGADRAVAARAPA